jgi:hypothetical protein
MAGCSVTVRAPSGLISLVGGTAGVDGWAIVSTTGYQSASGSAQVPVCRGLLRARVGHGEQPAYLLERFDDRGVRRFDRQLRGDSALEKRAISQVQPDLEKDQREKAPHRGFSLSWTREPVQAARARLSTFSPTRAWPPPAISVGEATNSIGANKATLYCSIAIAALAVLALNAMCRRRNLVEPLAQAG